MRLLSRSVIREIWPPFLLGFAAYTFILLIRTVLLLADFFVRRSATATEVAWLVLLSVPWMVVLTLPMAYLLGVLIGIGRLSGDSELVAMRACGVGPGSLYRPALGSAAVLSGAVFLLYNVALPPANEALSAAMGRVAATSVVNLVQPRTFREPRPGTTLFFDRIGSDGRSFEGVFLTLGEEGQAGEVIVAERGQLVLEGDRLWLELLSSTVHVLDPANPSRYRVNRNESQRILFAGNIDAAARGRVSYEKGLRAQSLPELLRAARRLERESPERHRLAWVEIHKKFAIPFACLAFAVIGVPLAETSRRGGKGSGFALSLVILVLYYVLLNNGETWAQDGKLPPAAAMWLPNLLLVLLGIAALRRSGRERTRSRLRFFGLRPGRKRERAIESERRAWLGGFLRFPALLDRYVLARFFAALFFVFLSIVILSLIVDYSEKADEVARNRPPAEAVAGYYRQFLVSLSVEILPFAVLIATLLGLGVLSRNNEDTAFKASGVSLFRLGAPILAVTLAASFGSFALGEYVLPAVRQQEAVYKNRIYGRRADYGLRTEAERHWYFGRDGRIWNREASAEGRLLSPAVFEFDEGFRLVRRWSAREAAWDGGAWTLRQGWVRSFEGAREASFRNFLEDRVPGDPPRVFGAERRLPDQMRLGELERYARRLKESGYPTDGLETALHNKLARPLLLPAMALLALPFAFRIGRRGALAGIGVGLALGIAFLITSAFFVKLGEVGALPPFLAAWSPNVLFATAASYLLLRVRT
jgi:LPS export ABC transporter permease LptG/LPS export ABC transporter permease LptF